MDMIDAKKIMELSIFEYSKIRETLWASVYDAVDKFLGGSRGSRGFLNDMRIAISEQYRATADEAWQDAGGTLPIDEDAAKYMGAAIQTEYGYVDQLAERYKLLKKDEEFDKVADTTHEAFARADGYAKSLDKFYANVKTRSAGNKMLTFVGEDGLESCTDCQKYKGKRHRASWWVSHNAIPPNRDFECHGYRCSHILISDDGNLWTI